MNVFPFFQKLPKLWACVVCCLASFEVYLLSASLFQGEFLPSFITQSAYALAIVPTVIICSAFGYIVYLTLKLTVSDTVPFHGASSQQRHRLIVSIRTLGAYFGCLIGMCATLFLCARNGPWRQILEGISGPNAGLSDDVWPMIFVVVFAATVLAAEKIKQGLLGGTNQWNF